MTTATSPNRATTSGTGRRVGAALAAVLLVTSCWGGDDGDDDAAPSTTAAEPGTTEPDEPVVTIGGRSSEPAAVPAGLILREGSADTSPASTIARPSTTPLTDDEAADLVDRLPEWDVDPDPGVTFERPAESLPPPIVGETIDGTFPPPPDGSDPADPADGPLEVLRFQPEGAVDVAPFLSVTFNQPMVAIDTFDALDDAEVPVVVEPAIDGRWRWIGTRTLRFELTPGVIDRLPAATEYTATVPAGTTSVTGGALAADVTWTFSTPPPTVEDLTGLGDATPVEPVFVATFDQRVVPSDALAAMSLTADDEPVALRIVADVTIDDPDLRAALASAPEGRAFAFEPVTTLPTDAALAITVGPDIPSAEGPLTGRSARTFTGRTFGALALVEATCGWEQVCRPGTPFVLRFNNPLDVGSVEPTSVSVDPEVDGLRIDVYGDTIELRGATRADTTYEVTVDADLTDVFGEVLGSDETRRFDVGDALPALVGPGRPLVTIDPFAETPSLAIGTVNHDEVRVRAWAVDPTEYGAYLDLQDSLWRDPGSAPPEDWSLVADEIVPIDAGANETATTRIDLASPFNQTASQLVVRIDGDEDVVDDLDPERDEAYWANQPILVWTQSTQLGLDAFVDGSSLHLWTTDLRSGAPLGGVPVELVGDGRVVTTDDEGLGSIELGEDLPVLGLYATADGEETFVPADRRDGWQIEPTSSESRWYVIDDRGIYRPGETVRIAGWTRRWTIPDGLSLSDADRLGYRAYDAQGAEIAAGEVDVNDLGGFNVVFDVPEGANLGPAWIELTLDGASDEWQGTGHQFQIQDFRTPEFEVTTRLESPLPVLASEPATLAVEAAYFSGGALPDAPVDWLVTTSDATYRPPGHDRYTFGVWTPWWLEGDAELDATIDLAIEEPCFDCPWAPPVDYESFTGRTDVTGTHYLEFELDHGPGDELDLPVSVIAEATVTDVDRQAWADRTTTLVHAGELYVGIRTDRPFVEAGEPIDVEAIVSDIDGGLVTGREVTVSGGRIEYERVGDEWNEIVADPAECTITSEDGPSTCSLPTELGGTYRITAVVTDDDGGRNRSELTIWVTGETPDLDVPVEQQELTVVPDQPEYAVGDVAEVFVRAPFAPAWGVAHVTVGDIVAEVPFEAEDGSAVVPVEIGEDWLPDATVHVTMTGATGDTPAFATGTTELVVPPLGRELEVIARPTVDAVLPGATTDVTVEVRDGGGEPVEGAAVTLVVVDEAVLALTGYELPDPLDAFYRSNWSRFWAQYFRSTVLLGAGDDESGVDRAGGDDAAVDADFADEGAAEESAEEPADAPASDGGAVDGDGSAAPIDVREVFDAVAAFAPDQRTGDDGTTTVSVTLPDSLTRYRVLAVAAAGAERFGSDTATITARLPLQIRPSAPRFANHGDRFELPVIVQNQTDTALTVDVAMQSVLLGDDRPVGQRLDVPANDRVEVRFPVETTSAGTAHARIVAAAGELSDASALSLPVYTPATSEAFATYGTIEATAPADDTGGSSGDTGAVAQPIAAPTGVIPEYGGLEINTSSTALQALTDAVLYLTEYRYASADAYASRIMAIAGLRDVLDAFEADGLPAPNELEATTRSDIDDLIELQNDDGGWAMWRRARPSDAWMTAQATHALVIARDEGFDVDAEALGSALAWLAGIDDQLPAALDERSAQGLRAYALHVRHLADDADPAAAIELVREGDLEVDALAWVWPSIIDADVRAEIRRTITNRAVDTAGGVTFATGYDETSALIAVSDRRTDAIVLDALITQDPDSDLIAKTVSALLAGQTRGRWNNAHENAFILLALDRYFGTFESVEPAFVARTWLGDDLVAIDDFVGRRTDRSATLVPMAELIDATASDVIVAAEGAGRLYYRLGLRYAPSDLTPDARDEGFVVDRTYEAVDDPDDVRRLPDGSWEIAAGATVRVRLTMVADARRQHVALVDPLPAGLEAQNPALAVTSTTPPEDADDDVVPVIRFGSWFDHQNLRDDRVEAFADQLPAGAYEYTYIARATTPGTFVAPPATAEEIYAPETFGRTRGDTVIVR